MEFICLFSLIVSIWMTIPRDRDGAKQKPLESEKKETSFHFPPDEKEALKKRPRRKKKKKRRGKRHLIWGEEKGDKGRASDKSGLFSCACMLRRERREWKREENCRTFLSFFLLCDVLSPLFSLVSFSKWTHQGRRVGKEFFKVEHFWWFSLSSSLLHHFIAC